MCSHLTALFGSAKPFNGQFWTETLCDKGSFGCVIFARKIHTKEDVVIKVECGVLRSYNEVAAYKALKGVSGIPRFHCLYTIRDHGMIVLDRLGQNLLKYMKSCGGSLPISEVYVLGKALVKILHQIHDRGVVHRDIKPGNIVLPINGELQPHLVDFGHAKRYRDETGKHKPESGECAEGTLPYMSIHVHCHTRYSRRDDIISLTYTLIHLAKGSLPWCGLSPAECEAMKRELRWSEITPAPLGLFLEHAEDLGYDEDPDYSYLEDILG